MKDLTRDQPNRQTDKSYTANMQQLEYHHVFVFKFIVLEMNSGKQPREDEPQQAQLHSCLQLMIPMIATKKLRIIFA